MHPGTWNLIRKRTALLMACILVGSLAACDEVAGPEPIDGSAPALSEFSFAPSQVSFQQLSDDQVVGDSLARIPIALRVHAEDPEGCVDRVGFVFAAGMDARGPQITGELEPEDAPSGDCANGWYQTTATVDLPRGAVGPYTVRVYAVGDDGTLGDQMQGLFQFALELGKPPVVESVEASADTIRPPAELQFVATVSDPDGLENIARVFVGTPDGGEPLPMYDDGVSRGDETADDGRYTATFDVPEETESGEGTFSFWAEDKNGLASDTLEKTIVVAE